MENETGDVPDKCFLLLEDGTVLTGKPFGARKPTDGEVGKLYPKDHACTCVNVLVLELYNQHVVDVMKTNATLPKCTFLV